MERTLEPRSRRGPAAPPSALGHAAAPASAPPRQRSVLKSVLVPTEHGGWGLTLEPVLLGLVVSPSWAGLGLGLAAFLAFLARTPLKIVLVDRHRNRALERTRLAQRVLVAYGLVLVVCIAIPLVRAPARSWLPLVVILPLVTVELWFDMRSRGRRLVPELAGAIGIAGMAAAIVLAGGAATSIAAICWILLAARAATSIVFVRDRVAGLHGRAHRPWLVLTGDIAAIVLAVTAIAIDRSAILGAAAVVGLVLVQNLLAHRPTPRAVVLGVTQTVLGLTVVFAIAVGILVA